MRVIKHDNVWAAWSFPQCQKQLVASPVSATPRSARCEKRAELLAPVAKRFGPRGNRTVKKEREKEPERRHRIGHGSFFLPYFPLYIPLTRLGHERKPTYSHRAS